MAKNLTILFAPMPGVGHVNACIGLAEVLLSRGHTIVFAIDQSFAGKLSPFGFTEETVTSDEVKGEKAGEYLATSILSSGLLSGVSALEKLKIMQNLSTFEVLVDALRQNEPQMKAFVAKHNPDVIVIDDFIGSPALIYANRPWVGVCSANPLFAIADDRTPPPASGLTINGDRNEWKVYGKESDQLFTKAKNQYNDWMKEEGLPTVETNSILKLKSPYLNIYGFPEELDYTDLRPLPEKWLRVDAFMRRGEKQEFKIPDKFRDRDIEKSKLIYLSMGTMGSADVNLMKRLVSILSKSQHKFIVSKGVLGDTYELADNMWGENSVPQIKVLPLVDVVITHGGNNSVTETFSCGKPMIIMPLFADQYDNAQRVEDKRFGLRLDPYNCSEQQLLDSIEKLLNDKELKHKLSVASKRIQNSQSIQRAAEKIEKLANNFNKV